MQTPGRASIDETGGTTPQATKIIVAIHGIGDQYRNATIQSVVSSFGRFTDYTAAMPLGRLGTGDGKSIFLKGPPAPQPPLDTIAFVELYWADIPRKVQTEGYRIEETKAWARTVVERLRARYEVFREAARKNSGARPGQQGSDLPVELHREDFSAAADAIEEMIETFAVLDRLLTVIEKMGLLKFNLNNLLNSYVGDVQIVADFPDQRRLILDQFSKLLHDVTENNEAEIYVIAHSEGTVVAFMGLLEAMARQPRANGVLANDPPAWIGQVRGFMTIGSPIDKHLILWPDLWDDLQEQHPKVKSWSTYPPIWWRNYYDYGDPVGFRLDTARDWLKDHNWKSVFEFEDRHDHGFSRYLFPGAAHIDYWGDEEVFGHFIETVVFAPRDPETGKPLNQESQKPETQKPTGRSFREPPPTKGWQRIGSFVIPYFVVYLLIFLGVYLVYKGTLEYLVPPGPERAPYLSHVFKNVAGISALMMGMITLARIPKLTRRWTMLVLGVTGFAIGAAAYGYFVEPEIKRWHTWGRLNDYPAWLSGAVVIGVAFIVICFANWAGRKKLWKPPWSKLRAFLTGTRPLMIPGAACVLLTVAYHVFFSGDDRLNERPLWPLILASAAFFYLWWLAILIFDLVFVWHRYIRGAVSQKYLTELRRKAKGTNGASPGVSGRTATQTAVTSS
jgi:hypothetical protein